MDVLRIPQEIWEIIFRYLDDFDRIQVLPLVCKHFLTISRATVSTLTLDFNEIPKTNHGNKIFSRYPRLNNVEIHQVNVFQLKTILSGVSFNHQIQSVRIRSVSQKLQGQAGMFDNCHGTLAKVQQIEFIGLKDDHGFLTQRVTLSLAYFVNLRELVLSNAQKVSPESLDILSENCPGIRKLTLAWIRLIHAKTCIKSDLARRLTYLDISLDKSPPYRQLDWKLLWHCKNLETFVFQPYFSESNMLETITKMDSLKNISLYNYPFCFLYPQPIGNNNWVSLDLGTIPLPHGAAYLVKLFNQPLETLKKLSVKLWCRTLGAAFKFGRDFFINLPWLFPSLEVLNLSGSHYYRPEYELLQDVPQAATDNGKLEKLRSLKLETFCVTDPQISFLLVMCPNVSAISLDVTGTPLSLGQFCYEKTTLRPLLLTEIAFTDTLAKVNDFSFITDPNPKCDLVCLIARAMPNLKELKANPTSKSRIAGNDDVVCSCHDMNSQDLPRLKHLRRLTFSRKTQIKQPEDYAKWIAHCPNLSRVIIDTSGANPKSIELFLTTLPHLTYLRTRMHELALDPNIVKGYLERGGILSRTENKKNDDTNF